MNILKKRAVRLLFSIIISAIIYTAVWLITPQGENEEANRMLVMIGGKLYDGIIQAVTFLLFVYGMLEMFWINYRLNCEKDAYLLRLLPEKENWVLSTDDINQLKLNVQNIEKTRKYYLTDLVKKCCTKYRLSKEASEVIALNDSQIDIYQSEMESEQSFIRYAAWAIPSVGFIGTVYGIGKSLDLAKEAATQEGIKKITDALGVAFDTTLWALILIIILMYTIHSFQKKQDTFFANMKDYIIENLINRFYK
ncbi:MAG: MotA/TolQ/ExbB proton channel family protein [Bacteroidales bacterium]|jgi:chemotaxis protein MotA|nr:MotA/TolQ/ExbB proton channel family protein [Bacteroidales bacterium]